MTESTTTGVHRVSGARDLVRVLRTAVREGRSVAVHPDLWWAHTGGGGGFGVPVRCWFRSPGATGGDPTTALPRPPAALLRGSVLFPRTGFDRDCPRASARNQAAWPAEHIGGRTNTDAPDVAKRDSLLRAVFLCGWTDPEWNTSGSTWHDLIHKGNHPRLRGVRAAWDPRGVFGGQS